MKDVVWHTHMWRKVGQGGILLQEAIFQHKGEKWKQASQKICCLVEQNT